MSKKLEYLIETLQNKKGNQNYGILLPKLFWHTVRKNCSSGREKLRSLEQFIQAVKGQNNFW